MRTFNHLIFNNVSMSGSVTTGSAPVRLERIEGYACQAVMTSATSSGGFVVGTGVTGTLKLQASCDPVALPHTPVDVVTNWTDISGSSNSVQFSGSLSVVWNASQVYYNYVRLVYVGTNGSGSISARFVGKGA